MARILRTEAAAGKRRSIMRGMAMALRAAALPGGLAAEEERDVLAFLALSLNRLAESVEETASAWERRSYWVKADRFRAQWAWVSRLLASLETSLRQDDLLRAVTCSREIAGVLTDLEIRPASVKGRPWAGAWAAWQTS